MAKDNNNDQNKIFLVDAGCKDRENSTSEKRAIDGI